MMLVREQPESVASFFTLASNSSDRLIVVRMHRNRNVRRRPQRASLSSARTMSRNVGMSVSRTGTPTFSESLFLAEILILEERVA